MAQSDLLRPIPTQTPVHAKTDWDQPHSRCVAVPLLLPGTVLNLNTMNSSYWLMVIDAAERRVMIRGGALFEEHTEAELVGAYDEGGVRTGWVIEGLRLELLTDTGPVLTSTVESVSIVR